MSEKSFSSGKTLSDTTIDSQTSQTSQNDFLPPISFGVEIEFNIAYLFANTPLPTSSTETRLLHFPGGPRSIKDRNKQEYIRRKAVHHHIATTLHTAGLPINLDDFSGLSMTNWQIASDNTVQPPSHGQPGYSPHYQWFDVEIKTPALAFCQKSIDDVLKVCELLETNYVTNVNRTAGLHVHIGRFALPDAFPLSFLEKFVAFLYVFEPQMSSIMPASRRDHNWGHSMRRKAAPSQIYEQNFGVRPTFTQMVAHFQSMPNPIMLIRQASVERGVGKSNNVNFTGAFRKIYDRNELMKTPRANLLADVAARKAVEEELDMREDEQMGMGNTVEFRQHPGTLDGEAIANWVCVLCGIVDFCERADPVDFFENLRILVEAEKYEQEGDEEVPSALDPIPANGSFTIIDMLNYIGMTQQAEYYKDKWVVHPDDLGLPHQQHEADRMYEWDIPPMREGRRRKPEDKRKDKLKAIWWQMKAYEVMRERRGIAEDGWKWNEDDAYWPEHKKKEVVPDPVVKRTPSSKGKNVEFNV